MIILKMLLLMMMMIMMSMMMSEFVFNVPTTANGHIGRGPQLQRLIQKTGGYGDQTWDPWVQDEWFNNYMAAPDDDDDDDDDDVDVDVDDEPIYLIDCLMQRFKPYCTQSR